MDPGRPMQHNLTHRTEVFHRAPQPFTRHTPADRLRYCLGGTLYMPATRQVMARIVSGELPDAMSLVLDFEDALAEGDLAAGEASVLAQLDWLAGERAQGRIDDAHIPLIFLRMRNLEQFCRFADRLTATQADLLTGFIFPKFYADTARAWLKLLEGLNARFATPLYGMPILEGRALAFRETRDAELMALKSILGDYRRLILNIRVGGTDFSSFFGLRRGMGQAIYDLLPVRDILTDILNVFGRAEEDWVVSGPVWEYFLAHKQDDIERVMQIDLHRALRTHAPIWNDAIDGLLREVALDKANGFVGKTIIHPSHLRYVNAMQAVTREEFDDATQIVAARAGGVAKSANGNKMNEANPHRNWAQRILRRADAYGVVQDERGYLALFEPPQSAAVRAAE